MMQWHEDGKSAEAIVMALAESDPWDRWYPGSPAFCHFCGEAMPIDFEDPDPHRTTCLYRLAKEHVKRLEAL